jgi:ABC-type uncharacterized transport system fused permease/ATPase subunit
MSKEGQQYSMSNTSDQLSSPEYVPSDGLAQQNGQELSAEPSEADIEEFMQMATRLEKELSSVVIGQERVIRELLLALFAGGHVLLEGVPGLGKTLLVRTLSDALTLKFTRIQFTRDNNCYRTGRCERIQWTQGI